MSYQSDALRQKQDMPLELKVLMTKQKIREWHDHFLGDTYIAFSGGKDSTVLLDLVRSIYPNTPAVFVDTGLEYPEIREFVKTIDNVTWLKPEMPFTKVIESHGYPVVSKRVAYQIRHLQNPKENNYATRNLYLTGIKRDGTKSKYMKLAKKWLKLIDAPFKVSEKCCNVMKKNPMKKYVKETGRQAFIGMMAGDSEQRKASYFKTGCNSFTNKTSNPMAFWKEEDIWEYLNGRNIPYCKIYDTNGIKNTGCMFCMFGVHMEKGENRFQMMKKTHPKQYDYCINKLGCGKVLDYINVDY